MTDQILEDIKAAQAAPTDDYMLWATVSTATGPQDIVLHTVRLPQSIGAEAVLSRARADAARTLAGHGFSPEEIAAAEYHIDALPDAEQVKAIIKKARDPDSELVLVDLVGWEAIRLRLHLTPNPVGGSDMEMVYDGLKIRRSATS